MIFSENGFPPRIKSGAGFSGSCSEAVPMKRRDKKSPGRNPGLEAVHVLGGSTYARLPPTAAELVVQTGGEHVDAAIVDADHVSRKASSGRCAGDRKALVL